jgi:hypothetical protein
VLEFFLRKREQLFNGKQCSEVSLFLFDKLIDIVDVLACAQDYTLNFLDGGGVGILDDWEKVGGWTHGVKGRKTGVMP